MAVDPVQFLIDQVTRVLQAMQWRVVRSDTSGSDIELTIRRPKPPGAAL